MDRQTRGRLSSLDLVPDEAQDDIVWALRELNKRDRSANDILFELNDRLAVKGVEPISKSAFNRKSVKLAAASRRLEEARFMFEGLADKFSPEKVDENSLVIAEFIKLLIFELAQEDAADRTPKQAMELASAHLAVIRSQKVSADRRQQLAKEFAGKATEAVEAVAKTAGLTPAAVGSIKASILGIRAEAAA